MPYLYVLEAVLSLNELGQEELHNTERPIAYLAYQNAEMNRDKKKRRRPFEPEEFYYYANKAQQNLPEPRYGAAAMELIERGLFPRWALFVFKDLSARAGDATPPEFLCLQCDDAIILAPSIDNFMINGMLIAADSASDQIRVLHSPCGKEVTARMPRIENKFEASEEVEIRLLA